MPDSNIAQLHPAARRPRIAIVSTYDELCGIAGYTRALERQLAPHADLTIFDLDQYLLRSKHRRIQRLGDAHIREIAAQLAAFDSVNIQLEYGTLGQTVTQIVRRFARLVDAAPALSVTFHTVLQEDSLPWEVLFRLLRKGRFAAASDVFGNARRARLLGYAIHGRLSRLQRWRKVSVIVHTKRDMRLMRDLYRLRDVYHHPLSFIGHAEAASLRARTSRADFPLTASLPPAAKLIGTFGFLSPYKGFDTAIRALQQLPEDYHLLIFGGIHPQSIKREEIISPYLQTLLDTAHIGQTPLDQFNGSGVKLSAGGSELAMLLADHPGSLKGRVHFMGALSDEQFYAAMAVCDVAVLPYREVGQASSGPLSVALEMGTPIIASRTAAFRAFARYHPGRLDFFDIGNFSELAARIRCALPSAGVPCLQFDTQSNIRLYLTANHCPADQMEQLACAAD